LYLCINFISKVGCIQNLDVLVSLFSVYGHEAIWVSWIFSSHESKVPVSFSDQNLPVVGNINSILILSRTTLSNLIKPDTNYPWVKDIQMHSNERSCSLQRGDNQDKASFESLKIVFSSDKNYWIIGKLPVRLKVDSNMWYTI
jgi:hypothetical protein